MTEEADHLWGITEVAQYLGISTNAAYKLTGPRAALHVPLIRINGRLRFRKSAIDRWLDLLTVSNVDTLERLRAKRSGVSYGKHPQAQTA